MQQPSLVGMPDRKGETVALARSEEAILVTRPRQRCQCEVYRLASVKPRASCQGFEGNVIPELIGPRLLNGPVIGRPFPWPSGDRSPLAIVAWHPQMRAAPQGTLAHCEATTRGQALHANKEIFTGTIDHPEVPKVSPVLS